MRRANPASCLVLRGGGTALPVGRGSAAAAALGRLSLLLRHLTQLLWRQPPPTAPGVPRIAGVRALVAEGAMSEARPEKHDGRRHDSQDGVVLPNLARFFYHGSYCIREREREREKEREGERELIITPKPRWFDGAPSVVAVAANDDFARRVQFLDGAGRPVRD